MEKTLQIRGVPEEVHAAVKTRAAQAGESVSDYLLHLVSEVVSYPSMAEIVERAKDAARSGGANFEDIEAAVREGRDR
ncbi:MAG: FitA-like ribbon-helix-helix domain-containing protein [Stackebrandtia sp.]